MIGREWEERLTIVGDEAYLPGEKAPTRRTVAVSVVPDMTEVERARAEKLERKRAQNREYMRGKRASDPEYRERERLANRARDRQRKWGREHYMSDVEIADAIRFLEERLARFVAERVRRQGAR